ncbi:MAG: cobalt-precorrin 5A hydrolase [Blautia sp.]|nr:cobalt-precorrin 5A hydrolase [Blautia sp.]MCM1202143.1 cobalt-precorrin 5A hydrolase [Bacteroides fragilis]
MRILSIISFTENGVRLSESIAEKLEEVRLYTKCSACAGGFAYDACHAGTAGFPVEFVKASVSDWAGERMREKDALLFIGACGIAVRAIAPCLTDKLHDAPVLVMDEKGSYVIPILSGHMGGANALARHLAEKTGAEPVITTATDIRRKFAVDLFAKKNGLFPVDKDGIVKVSSKALAGKEITVSAGPEGVRFVPYPPAGFVDVVVTSEERAFDASVVLRPKEYVIGIGCKRGKSGEEIADLIARKMEELAISTPQIFALASVSQKRGEAGLLAWCRREGIPFLTYTAEELQEVAGEFTASAFVKEQVGVDNVCERAALRACGEGGELLAAKYAENGMTIAVARRKLTELVC